MNEVASSVTVCVCAAEGSSPPEGVGVGNESISRQIQLNRITKNDQPLIESVKWDEALDDFLFPHHNFNYVFPLLQNCI